MIVQWYAHLPGVVLQSSQEWSFGAGKLAHIPFDEWRRLDGGYPWSDTKYEQSRPVFYIGETDLLDDLDIAGFFTDEADLPGDLDVTREFILECVHTLYLAFLLAQGAPLLPIPSMSVTYLRIPVAHDVFYITREIGPFEREWIIYGNKIDNIFDDARLSSVRGAYNLVAAFDPDNALSGVVAGIHTLELTARPEFWWHNRGMNLINGFVHCMAALEHILLPPHDEAPAGMKLTPTFGQHAAVITSVSREDLRKRAEHFSALYRLRSRLVHGETGLIQLTDQEWNCLYEGRLLLQTVLLRAMALWQVNNDHDSLPLLLAKAFRNADVHRSLFS